MKPGEADRLIPEKNVAVPHEIDYDCDQLRALIKLFIERGLWALDHFWQALGRVERAQITSFLEQRGEKDGNRTMVYHLA